MNFREVKHMMGETNPIDLARFNTGIKYIDYLSNINVNKNRFIQNYETAKEAVTENSIQFFTAAFQKGATRILLIGEDWCPDVYRGMPLIARISEVSGMELKIFPRDTNLDIIDKFLKNGKHRAIPVVVFYTNSLDYLCHWIERPETANKERMVIEEQINIEMAGKSEQIIREERRERINAQFPNWQCETVIELKKLLGLALNL